MPDATFREPTVRDRLGAVADYLFGRNALIGFASFMLLIISGFATWHGMRDFIVGVSTSQPAKQDLPGGLSISDDVLVIAIVVALTFLMWLALREAFAAKRRLIDRLVTFPLYLFLLLWSVGFGYGFWWSLIAGQEATRSSFSGMQEDARDAAGAIAARLEAVRTQVESVASWSDGQMSREEASGGSCGVPSGAGRGPLYNARRSVRDTVTTLKDGLVRSWITPVQADLEALQKAAAASEGGTIEERQKQFEARAAEIRGRSRSIAARSNELGKSTAAEMRALAQAVSVPPGQPGFTCHDPTLAERLRSAASQAEQPAIIRLRQAAFNEGPAGVANAVKRLWENLGTYMGGAVSYVFSGGKSGGFTAGGEPITGRDMIALLATIGIDLGLFVLTVLNPAKEPPPVRPSPALTRQIREAIDTAISRAKGADLEWVRRHFVHHKRASYFVIPNLYSVDPGNEEESSKALAMNQLAGVLSDLGLVRWPNKPKVGVGDWRFGKSELDVLLDDERKASGTDLSQIRKKFAEEQKVSAEEAKPHMDRHAIRNHGLFSKAERTLQIAGWSERARADVEVFPIVETDGLTPLLMVLNEQRTERNDGREGKPAAAAAA